MGEVTKESAFMIFSGWLACLTCGAILSTHSLPLARIATDGVVGFAKCSPAAGMASRRPSRCQEMAVIALRYSAGHPCNCGRACHQVEGIKHGEKSLLTLNIDADAGEPVFAFSAGARFGADAVPSLILVLLALRMAFPRKAKLSEEE